ncbi:MAG: EAL domain-containing protein [Pseudomonadota bacterium]
MKLVGHYLRNILAVLLIVLVVMLVLQLIQLQRAVEAMDSMAEASLETQLDLQLASRGEAIAGVLAFSAAESLASGDRDGMYKALAPIVGREGVMLALLIDPQGRIAHDGTSRVLRYAQPVVEVVPDLTFTASVPTPLRRADSYSAVSPVLWQGERVGFAYVSLSRADVLRALEALHGRFDEIARQQRQANIKAAVLFALGLLAMGALLSTLAARRMVKPIEQLVASTRRIGEGFYDVSVASSRQDELGELALAIEDMSSELAARDDRISTLAFGDPLTHLANRVAFTEAAAEALHDQQEPAAVVFLDLDDFKRVNDTLGHAAGDRMLATLAKRLKDTLTGKGFADLVFDGRAIAPVARWGGDEFSLLLMGVDSPQSAIAIAEEILVEMTRPMSIGGMDVVGSASVGIALYPSDSDDLHELLNQADVAMYHAKHSGAGRITVFAPSMRRSNEHRLLLESELRFAIERDQLRLDYQPVLDPFSETLTGLAARLRWHHPERGALDVDAFMPLAESVGFAARIQAWAVARALREFTSDDRVRDSDIELMVCLLSDRIDPDYLTDALADALEFEGIDSRRLILKVQENRLLRSPLRCVPLLEVARGLGVQAWVDRFGSGHTPINRLRGLPLDGMSLDATFVQDMDDSPAGQSLTAAVIGLAHSLGLRVVANGVATRAQLEFLRRSGCDGVRGVYVGEPGSIRDVLDHHTESPETSQAI